MKFIFVIISLFFLPTLVFSCTVEEALQILLPKGTLPRRLNSDDLPKLQLPDGQWMKSLEDDFNEDGIIENVVTGVFEFPNDKNKYFLMVYACESNPVRYTSIYNEPSPIPFFLHLPKTTGPGDPGNQAFSISFCLDCSKGKDYFWDGTINSFRIKKWDQSNRLPNYLSPPIELSSATINTVLQIVGKIPDILKFVEKTKEEKAELLAEINPHPTMENSYWVILGKKLNGGREIYDELLVNEKERKVVKRKFSNRKNQ